MDGYNSGEFDPTLQNLARQWCARIQQATQHKEEVFGASAREMLQYYSGPRNWEELMGRNTAADEAWQDTQFKMHVNKAFEYVSLFGPSLFYDNAVRTVKPRAPLQIPGSFFMDPFQFQAIATQEQARVAVDGLRAILLEGYLNWTPHEHRLERESRLAVEEGLIKGRGVLWTELVRTPDGSMHSVTSKWDSVDNLLMDPDASNPFNASWIARRCVHPTWKVERDFGLRPGCLKGGLESQATQAGLMISPDRDYNRRRGLTSDLIEYYQIYSKMGIGGRLQGIDVRMRGPLDEMFGDYCYLAIAPSVTSFPLNLHPDIANAGDFSAIKRSAEWPIPFWAGRSDWWPCTFLDFHPLFDCPWPLPSLVAARGELRFLNWVMSFLAGHIRNTTRDFIAVKKSLSEEIKATILNGKDLELIEIDSDHGVIDECVKFLQHPAANGDVWKFIEQVENNFDKRVGLTELMYGKTGATQPRSATEVNLKNEAMDVRPDDMARIVEAWQSEVAAKEAAAARYSITSEDVRRPLGDMAAMQWDQFVFTPDLAAAYHQLEYRIEAGSTRRPNKEFAVRQMGEAMQSLAPILQQYGQLTGDMTPLNNLLADYAKSRDLDPNRYQLSMAPLPPMLPSSAPGQPNQEGSMQVPPASGEPMLG
jgi:hypothetical protein